MTEDKKPLVTDQFPLTSRSLEKEIIKEAIREWMDEKYAAVGKWTVGAFSVALTGGLIYLALVLNGWHK